MTRLQNNESVGVDRIRAASIVVYLLDLTLTAVKHITMYQSLLDEALRLDPKQSGGEVRLAGRVATRRNDRGGATQLAISSREAVLAVSKYPLHQCQMAHISQLCRHLSLSTQANN